MWDFLGFSVILLDFMGLFWDIFGFFTEKRTEFLRSNLSVAFLFSGFLAYYEICNYGYTIVEDNKALAPYGYKDTDWVGFENPKSLVYKAKKLIKGKEYCLVQFTWYVLLIDLG